MAKGARVQNVLELQAFYAVSTSMTANLYISSPTANFYSVDELISIDVNKDRSKRVCLCEVTVFTFTFLLEGSEKEVVMQDANLIHC